MTIINRLQLKWEQRHPEVKFTETFPFKVTYKIGNHPEESATGQLNLLDEPTLLIYPDGNGQVLYTNFIKSIERINEPEKSSSRPWLFPMYNNNHFLKVTLTNDQTFRGYSSLFDDDRVLGVRSDSSFIGIRTRVITSIEQLRSPEKE